MHGTNVKIFEVLIFGPLLLLHMITQEQFNEYVQHKSLKLFEGLVLLFCLHVTRVTLL